MITCKASRRKPYTEIGIRRMKCFRCPRRARHQWNICSMGNVYAPVCLECDVALNALVLKFMKHPRRRSLMKEYTASRNPLTG